MFNLNILIKILNKIFFLINSLIKYFLVNNLIKYFNKSLNKVF